MADNTPIEWTDASWNPIRARNKSTGKQWGQWHPDALRYKTLDGISPPPNMKIGKKAAGRSLDGREWKEFPA